MTQISNPSDELVATLQKASQHAEAGEWPICLDLCRTVLEKHADILFANYLAGIANIQLGAHDDAIVFLRASVEQDETDQNKLSMLSDLLLQSGQAEGALPYLERWAAIAPGPDVFNRLGAIHADAGRIGEAIRHFRRSLELQPNENAASAGLYPLLRITCDWGSELDALSNDIDRLNQGALERGDATPEPPFDNVHRIDDPKTNFLVARSWSARLITTVGDRQSRYDHIRDPGGPRKLRIGYLSGDLHDHAISHLMRGVFRMHDRGAFEIRTYSHGPNGPSPYREDIQHASDAFLDIRDISDTAAAELIHADKVDILVDLMGFTRNNRLGICARRPAPIQVTYLGFPGTSGADFFDYNIVDPIVAPPESHQYFSENLVFLQNAYQANDNTQKIPKKFKEIQNNNLDNFDFLFCSFNNPIKIDQLFFNIWMNLLKSVPNSGLWILQNNKRAVDNLTRFAVDAGVAPERLVFAEMLPRTEHLARITRADLGLDTQIYNGHTTTSDALWAGLPVIAMKGRHFASRVSASLLSAAGLPELVTESAEQYAKRALYLATHPEELAEIRRRIITNRSSCNLFNTPNITKNLEQAYQEMWRRYLNGEPATAIEVASLT